MMTDVDEDELGVGVVYDEGEMLVMLSLGEQAARMSPHSAFVVAQRLATMAQEASELQHSMEGMSPEVRDALLKDWMRRASSTEN